VHRTEADELVHCLECGAEISLALDRTFALDDDVALCFACAIKRGGSYDAAHDTWSHAPNLRGLRMRE
jgi:hypothetical protein